MITRSHTRSAILTAMPLQAKAGVKRSLSNPSISVPAKSIATKRSKVSATDTVKPTKERRKNDRTQITTSVTKTKVVEEPFVIPKGVTEQECMLRTTITLPALPFDLEAARKHLCSVDSRFIGLFENVPLQTYQEVLDPSTAATPSDTEPLKKELNLFKTITTSVVGQQISWLAARSVMYKFCRLYFPDQMPETPDYVNFPRDSWPFPTPLQILNTADADLRAVGLSFAKIKYVKDLSARIADGRLDIRTFIQLQNEEDCITELCKIKGVGRWTSEMILMFALRKPDILPCGDLGVQKGMLNFFLSDRNGPKVNDKKRKPGKNESKDNQDGQVEETSTPSKGKGKKPKQEKQPQESNDSGLETDDFDRQIPNELGLNFQVLASRAKGNKIKPGLYLSPDEMKALAKKWQPYRSVACVFMWSLVDA